MKNITTKIDALENSFAKNLENLQNAIIKTIGDTKKRNDTVCHIEVIGREYQFEGDNREKQKRIADSKPGDYEKFNYHQLKE